MSTDHNGAGRQGGALLLSLLISLGAIFLLFREVDLAAFRDALENAQWGYVLLMLAVYPLGMLMRAWRWLVMLDQPMRYWRGFHIINISYMLSAILPFRLGDFAKILLMSREPQQNMGGSLTAVTVERLFDLMLALCWIGIGLALLPEGARLPQETASALGFLLLMTFVGMIVVLFMPRSHPFLLKLAGLMLSPLPQKISAPLLNFATQTLGSLHSIAQPRRLAVILFRTTLTWLSYMLFFYVGLFAFFGRGVPLEVGFLVTGFIAIGIAAPSLPGAVGVFQAAAVLGLRTAGYDTSAATSYAWVSWIVQMIMLIGGGVIGLAALSLSFGKLTQDVRANIGRIEESQPEPNLTAAADSDQN